MIKLSELDPILCTQESLHYTSMQTLLYYVLHGISALEVVVLYLSRYQHHDENLAGKLSQSWSEKSSGSTRKRMDAFKSLWSVALAWVDIGLNFDAVLLCATTQEEEVKCCKIEREKKGFLVVQLCFWSHQRTHLSYVEPLSFLIHLQLLECVSNLSGAFFATQQQHYHLL